MLTNDYANLPIRADTRKKLTTAKLRMSLFMDRSLSWDAFANILADQALAELDKVDGYSP